MYKLTSMVLALIVSSRAASATAISRGFRFGNRRDVSGPVSEPREQVEDLPPVLKSVRGLLKHADRRLPEASAREASMKSVLIDTNVVLDVLLDRKLRCCGRFDLGRNRKWEGKRITCRPLRYDDSLFDPAGNRLSIAKRTIARMMTVFGVVDASITTQALELPCSDLTRMR